MTTPTPGDLSEVVRKAEAMIRGTEAEHMAVDAEASLSLGAYLRAALSAPAAGKGVDDVAAAVERLKDRTFPQHECPAESAAVWNVALYELEAALTRQPVAGDGWISVNDRLPDDGTLVMVYAPVDGGRIDFDGREEGVWVEHYNAYEHFIAVGGSRAAGPDCVCVGPSEDAPYTHWRPMPAAPTGPAQGDGEVGS